MKSVCRGRSCSHPFTTRYCNPRLLVFLHLPVEREELRQGCGSLGRVAAVVAAAIDDEEEEAVDEEEEGFPGD